MKKRIGSLCMCLALVLSLLPVGVLAEELPEGKAVQTVETVTETYVPDVNLPDNDELFAGYVNQLFYGQQPGIMPMGNWGTTSSVLNDREQKIYGSLKSQIGTTAASGGSTEFAISAEDLGSISWTTTATEDALRTEASQKFAENVNTSLILDCLLVDCPYELYWFDKTAGVRWGYSISSSGGTATISNLTVTFRVAEAYAGSGSTAEAPNVDVAKASSTKTAAENAQKIAGETTGTTYEKLLTFKNEICNLVSYNDEAADNNSTPYGDPWQLIYVFDGNDTTNVVCEGYAKAFQYLCDLSTFTDGTVCYTVSGQMSGGTGAGGHMWNIVTLGGNNYLVDVTNCDGNSVGNPDKLFLKAPDSGGSVTSGYKFTFDASNSITYTYDADQITLYGNDILTLAEADYDPDAGSSGTEPTTYTVAIDSSLSGGTITASSTSVTEGTEVTLTVTPDENYELVSTPVVTETNGSSTVSVTGNGTTGDPYKFTMPAYNVTVTATFQEKSTEPEPTTPGSVTTSLGQTSQTAFIYGDTITVNVTMPSNVSGTVSIYNGSDTTPLATSDSSVNSGGTTVLTIDTVTAGLTPGATYALTAKTGDDVIGSVNVTVSWLDTDAVVSLPTDEASTSGWYKADVTLTAPDGYGIVLSLEDLTTTTTPSTVEYSTEGDNSVTYYLVNDSGQISAQKTVAIKLDKTAPTVNQLSVSEFDDVSATVTVMGQDSLSGVADYALEISPSTGVAIQETNGGVFSITGLTELTEYTVTATVTDGAGNPGTDETKFTTAQSAAVSLADATVTVTDGPFTYNGSSQIPTVTVTLGEVTLTEDEDYTLSYSNTNGGAGNTTNAGTITITVTGTGDYGGAATATYTIAKADQTDFAISSTGPATIGYGYELITTGGAPNGEVTYQITGTSNGGEALINETGGGGYELTPIHVGTVTVTATNGGSSNYNPATSASVDITINKGQSNAGRTAVGMIKAGAAGSVELPAVIMGTSYGDTSSTGYQNHSPAIVTQVEINPNQYSLTYVGGEGVVAGEEYTLTIPVDGGQDYEDYYVTVTLTGTDKDIPEVTADPIIWTYTPDGVPASAIEGTATFNGETVAGTWAWTDGTNPSAIGPGDYQATFTPADSDTYSTVTVSVRVVINRAIPTLTIAVTDGDGNNVTNGTISGDEYITVSGTFTLPTGVTPTGTSETISVNCNGWNFGNVTVTGEAVQTYSVYVHIEGDDWQPGATYTVTATYEGDALLDEVTAICTLTIASSGTTTPSTPDTGDDTDTDDDDDNGGSTGGGSSSSSRPSTSTTENDDGSTTTTVTRPNGTVTETTQHTDGSTTVVETDRDGTVTTTQDDGEGNRSETVERADGTSQTTVSTASGAQSTTTVDADGQVEAQVDLPSQVTTASQIQGETVSLPMPSVTAARQSQTAPAVTITTNVPTPVQVEIPVERPTVGTVAVLVHPDGSEEIVKTSVTTDGGVVLAVEDGATVKIVDNTKNFSDVPASSWYSDAVDFASSRELFSGTSAATFSPEVSMTRGMLTQVLYSLENNPEITSTAAFTDVSSQDWYASAVNWAAGEGVVTGYEDGSFGANDVITREQLAVMLYRYAQTAGYDTSASTDLSGYSDAGQISSYAAQALAWANAEGLISGTSDTTLSPTASATRAQVATILMRFCQGNFSA